MTGLPNRKLALGQITRAIALAKRDLRPVGLLCIDIDGFTRLNHRLGNVAGDQILRQVGERIERIARSLRGSDSAARTAGDELGEVSVVLTAMGLPGDGSIVAVRLLRALAQPYRVAGEGAQRSVAASASRRTQGRRGYRRSLQSRQHGRACGKARGGRAVTGTARLVQTLAP